MFDKIKSMLESFSKDEINLLHRVDLHSHLIPSIDDGVKSLDESISLIRQLKECGFRKIITTPHTMSHRYCNTKDSIYEGYEALKNELARLEIDIELEVASEYYHDQHFLDLIDSGDILTFGDNYVLFELSYGTKPFMLEETVYKLKEAGYKPVLAHPERYVYYDSKKDYRKLKDMGLFFQINIISTQNFYGKRAKKAVEKIIKLGMVDFIGSDIHSQKYMDMFKKSLSSGAYLNIMTKNRIKNNSLK